MKLESDGLCINLINLEYVHLNELQNNEVLGPKTCIPLDFSLTFQTMLRGDLNGADYVSDVSQVNDISGRL